jgi:hypothetical protein
MLNQDCQVNYVWSSPWFIGLPLFYLNRYIPLIDAGMFVRCKSSYIRIPFASYAAD